MAWLGGYKIKAVEVTFVYIQKSKLVECGTSKSAVAMEK